MQGFAEVMMCCAEMAASEYVNTDVCKSGMTALNALSERFEVRSFRAGVHYLLACNSALAYNSGVLESPLHESGPAEMEGVTLRFKLDYSMIAHPKCDALGLQIWFDSIPLDVQGTVVQWHDDRDADGAHTSFGS
jgi:DNA gyrase/topoisomerase IV subunit B